MDQAVIDQADLRQDAWLETLCAFANGRGGSLLVEVPETRRRKTPLETLEWLPVRIYEELGITCEVNLVMDGGRMGIEVTVLPSAMPVSLEGRFFQRRGGETALLTGVDLVRFLRGRDSEEEAPWERRPASACCLEDLDPDALRMLLRAADVRASSAEDARPNAKNARETMRRLAALGLADEASGFFDNACVLLAHPSPDKLVEGAFTVIGFFEGTLREERTPAHRYEAHGSLMAQVEQAMAEVLRQASMGRHPSLLPPEALREALLNALVHKDYEAGAPIQVSVYPDRVTITNVGRPPETWTTETLLSPHSARPGNPVVAATLAAAGLVGSWGRGVALMADACAKAGLPAPLFTLEADETTVTLPLCPAESSSDLRLSRVDRAVLDLLRTLDHPTAADLARSLAVSDSTVRRALRRLTQLQLIERRGSTKTGFWIVLP